MLAIAWQYLTGRAVATDPTNRQLAEWPPHPDRVFQALVAAWGAEGESVDGRAALAWLGQQAAPGVAAPSFSDDERPDPVKTYVPVNDIEAGKAKEYGDKLIALMPAQRTRKERYFPAIPIGDQTCALIWPAADPAHHRPALDRLAQGVTNLGHSSSLVRMWVSETPPLARWLPVGGGSRRRDFSLRVPDDYRLDALVAAFAGGGPDWHRPPMAQWHGYAEAADAAVPSGAFDRRMLILRWVDGDRPGLRQTLAFTQALRGALLSKVPEAGRSMVSGHAADGAPLDVPHLAYVPLAFVAAPHADGHLLGLGLVLPKDITAAQESALWQALDAVADPDTGEITVVAGAAGAITVQVDDRPAPPRALRPATWCGASTTWATVTPIVIDRFARKRASHAEDFPEGLTSAQIAMRKKSHQREAMDDFFAENIREACRRQGLPEPSSIALSETSFLIGTPASEAFVPLLRKDGSRRWHMHARITFPRPIAGPLLLGAGRYRGYGFCRPLISDLFQESAQ